MKYTLFLSVFLFAIAFRCSAQEITAEELIGTWRVIKVEIGDGNIGAAGKKKMASIQDAFLKSRFHFKTGSHFSFDFASPEMRIKDGSWKISKVNSVEVRDWKDKSSLLMKIYVKKDGAPTFLIDETPFILSVRKD